MALSGSMSSGFRSFLEELQRDARFAPSRLVFGGCDCCRWCCCDRMTTTTVLDSGRRGRHCSIASGLDTRLRLARRALVARFSGRRRWIHCRWYRRGHQGSTTRAHQATIVRSLHLNTILLAFTVALALVAVVVASRAHLGFRDVDSRNHGRATAVLVPAPPAQRVAAVGDGNADGRRLLAVAAAASGGGVGTGVGVG